MKEPRYLTHKNLSGVLVVDDDKDLSPPPDVPPILVTTAERDNLESEEAISNETNSINKQNTSNDNGEDGQYHTPRFIDVGVGLAFRTYLLLMFTQETSKQKILNSECLEIEYIPAMEKYHQHQKHWWIIILMKTSCSPWSTHQMDMLLNKSGKIRN